MKKLFLILFAVTACVLVSCTAEIKITSTDSGLEYSFNGAAEKGFQQLINSISTEDQAFIDTVQIEQELKNSGFKKVLVSQKTPVDLSLYAVPGSSKNFISDSGIVCKEGQTYRTDFSRETLLAFYNSADAQIVQFLDLLLAPVFNDEEMSVDEYLEVIAAFYGDSVAEEMAESNIKVTVQNGLSSKSEKWTKTYSLAQILCGLSD